MSIYDNQYMENQYKENQNIILYDILKYYILNNNTSDSNICVVNSNNIKNFTPEITSNIQINNPTSLECKSNFKSESNMNDPWELAINDENFYLNNKISRIFPSINNSTDYSKIKIDDESFSFITIREIADMISKIICHHLLKYNLNPQKIKVADYTSGVGGNVLSFLKYFKYVYAIEISEKRADFLKNNIELYGYDNVEIINKCAIEFNSNDMINLNLNVIFIDPPWGGSNYKSSDNLTLKLANVEIENLIINIADIFLENYKKITNINPKELYNNYNNKFIVIKLPKNYDIENFYNHVKKCNELKEYKISSYLYILNKMLIVVCELKYLNIVTLL
jgi:16S rRNA G966 N2-methylase RsmD